MVERDGISLYIVFNLSDNHYGLSIESVIQIVHMVAITEIPESPLWLAGVIGFRGRVIPVVDLRVRFGFPKIPFKLNTPIIIIQSDKMTAGLIVDRIEGVEPLILGDLQTPKDLTIQANFIKSITNQDTQVTIIPDLPIILAGTEKFTLKNIPGEMSRN